MTAEDEGVKTSLRDPTGINSHLALAFEEVFAEPEQVHSCDCVWNGARGCFNGSRTCCYNILSGLCGLCLALSSGCDFAYITFQHVWCYTPQARMCQISMVLFGRLSRYMVDCALSPVCDQCAKCCNPNAMLHHKEQMV